MALNYLQCENAKPQGKPYKLTDGEGLYLQVMPTGGRYWRYKYRMHGKARCLSIGVYPDVSLAGARKALAAAKEQIRQNIDPYLARQEQRQLAQYQAAQTFEAIALEWHEKNKDTWTPRHAAYILRRLELHTFKQIGHYPINQLTPAIIMACLQKVEKTGPEMARRVLSMCSRIFHYAGATGRADRDMTFGLKHGLRRYTQGHYASITLDELPGLLEAIHSNRARLYPQTLLCLRLMLLTFVRTCELIEAKWEEFDFGKAMWTIPAERMKTRKLHKVPLSRQALAILHELKELNGRREYVFPSIPRPRKPMSNGTILKALERMGYKNRMTGHGFRALAMGVLKQNLNFRHEPVDRQLAHVPRSSVDRAYDRADYLPQRITMMQEYADYLDSLTTNPQQQRKNHDRTNPPTTYTLSFGIPAYPGGVAYAGRHQPLDFPQGNTIRPLPEAVQDQRKAERLEDRGHQQMH
ncbi:tyrosine-type recombinase/integrase [Rufibacter quisquiliarum]|uniref:Integrase n=1 Tax=Rufibacter quisquiliarum TaxID=1549639 RepID=A0A839GCA6_9BACT|nr:integrase arm-type DNA-binding domain-containing protein [Rufibacter quisquiliarum]MBA9076552.1 integrase [Rufibacter quisquiliarum]